MSTQSAVIVLHDQETDSIVLTKRSAHLNHHPGEICFPGGRWEAQDSSLWFTALRELKEELAIDSTRVQLIDHLQPEITLNNVIIYPWLASIANIKPYAMNKNEVDEVILLPMQEVKKMDNYCSIFLEKNGRSFESCRYIPGNYFVWGATARIMKQLTQNLF
ncbi:MutT/nudix family transporter protein (plasmid) [Legionella adelaidensis]|uniref:MutT/nudix family transporter protein n=1 Tax=Legionella adelaidensis TaxID=45056 RepID=A0A0W0R231_9GAMM|nr:CoA pyrophosphatase [Legionella adelaidensis]KTC65112.1 MutT/nudix family transporter protein [Legionella adelaidensis]VEH85368.1 MutT/nudix family transporter protein [Legionella adelaidensis]